MLARHRADQVAVVCGARPIRQSLRMVSIRRSSLRVYRYRWRRRPIPVALTVAEPWALKNDVSATDANATRKRPIRLQCQCRHCHSSTMCSKNNGRPGDSKITGTLAACIIRMWHSRPMHPSPLWGRLNTAGHIMDPEWRILATSRHVENLAFSLVRAYYPQS